MNSKLNSPETAGTLFSCVVLYNFITTDNVTCVVRWWRFCADVSLLIGNTCRGAFLNNDHGLQDG